MTAIDYAAKGREIARIVLRGSQGELPEKPPLHCLRIVGIDATKLTEAQAKQIADAYRASIASATRKA